jgi:hypothetical protein
MPWTLLLGALFLHSWLGLTGGGGLIARLIAWQEWSCVWFNKALKFPFLFWLLRATAAPAALLAAQGQAVQGKEQCH